MKVEIVQIDEFGNIQATYNFHRSPFDFYLPARFDEIEIDKKQFLVEHRDYILKPDRHEQSGYNTTVKIVCSLKECKG